MKNGLVMKNAGGFDTAEELALINSYSRRELSLDEVYLFSVALCDNDVDRDYERFTLASLKALEKLFVGKTGIIDHDPTAKNQKARVISCRVEAVPGEKTALGEDLYRLTARAYIRRTAGNTELIEAIDSGIVKEVSVGCSIGRTVCSICGADMHAPSCGHVKGRTYEGNLCFGELCDPKDAYEFSFVAVPAQRAAGVIKSVCKEKTSMDIKKLLEGDSLSLEGEGMEALRGYIRTLTADAEGAAAYREELVKRLTDGFKQKGIAVGWRIAKSVTDKLSIGELRALIDAVGDGAREKCAPQLCRTEKASGAGNTEFRI
jgi:hypothetical protein